MKLEKRDSRDVQWLQDPNASVRVDGDKSGQYFESGKFDNNMDGCFVDCFSHTSRNKAEDVQV